jgi:putative oxidoreductase
MKNWLVFLASLAFGALFLWSGIAKIKDPISFAEAIRNYRIVGDPIAPALAHFLPWLEVFAGFAVMWERMRQGASALLTGMLIVFTIGIVSAWIRGLDITCGCFGGEETINYPVKVTQNLLLIAAGIWIGGFWRNWREWRGHKKTAPVAGRGL